jgi:two-component system sensor histidine kinase ChvG
MEFDTMVATLKHSEELLRQAAEENAHALKGPLAVMSQSIEPLRRSIAPNDIRALRSVQILTQSIERLDNLVSVARRIDETIAGLIDRPRRRISLSNILETLGQGYSRLAAERNIGLDLQLTSRLAVKGDEEMLEIIFENLLDNALDFSPPGTRISVSLHADRGLAYLSVTDQGRGVAEGDLERIFDRHHSIRPDSQGNDADHFGLGLWIVRRNAEAMGGHAQAENTIKGGLCVTVSLLLDE